MLFFLYGYCFLLLILNQIYWVNQYESYLFDVFFDHPVEISAQILHEFLERSCELSDSIFKSRMHLTLLNDSTFVQHDHVIGLFEMMKLMCYQNSRFSIQFIEDALLKYRGSHLGVDSAETVVLYIWVTCGVIMTSSCHLTINMISLFW